MTGTRCMWRTACLSMLLAVTCLHGQAPRAEAEEPRVTAATAVEGAAEETSAPAQTAAEGDDAEALAKQLSNPLASLISLPFQLNYDTGFGPDDEGYRYALNIQPVAPFQLSQVYRKDHLRAYREPPPAWDYGEAHTRTLNPAGCLNWASRQWFVCEALAGARVRVDELDGLLLITYRRTTLRQINLRTGATTPVLLPGPQL